MLPSFPSAQKLLDEEWSREMFAAKSRVFSPSVHPKVFHIIEGKSGDFQREDGRINTVEIETHQVSSAHDLRDGRGMTLQEFKEKAREAGEAFGQKMWKMVLSMVDAAVAETGNRINVSGGIRQEDFLRMLEMGICDFDEAGNPTRRMVCGSEFFQEISSRIKEWETDAAFKARVAEIISHKRAEFNAREARRRLVG